MPTLTPEQQDEDLKNPSQQDFLRDFENRGTLSEQQLADRRANHIGGNSQQQAASNEKQALNDTAAGKAAIEAASTAASTIASPVAGRLVKLVGKIKVNKKTSAAGGVLAVILILLGLALLAAPNFALISFKENLIKKLDSQTAALTARSDMAFAGKLFTNGNGLDTSGTCKVKVMCRYVGISETQKLKLEKAGITLENEKKISLGKLTRYSSDSIKFNGRSIAAKDYQLWLRDTGFRQALHTAYKPSYASFTDSIAEKLRAKIKYTRNPNWVADEKDKTTIRKNVYLSENPGGATSTVDGGTPADTTNNNPDKQPVNYGSAAGDIQSEVDDLKAKALAGEVIDSLPTNTAEAAAMPEYVGKGSISKALGALGDFLNPASIGTWVCTAYQLTNAVLVTEGTIDLANKIRFAANLVSLADKAKSGDIKNSEMTNAMNMLMKPDSTGDVFDQSFGHQYVTEGTLSSKPLSVSAQGSDTVKTLSTSLHTFENAFGNKTVVRGTCKALTNPFVIGVLSLTSFIPGAGQLERLGTTAIGEGVKVGATTVIKDAIAKAVKAVAERLTTKEGYKATLASARNNLVKLAKEPSTAIFLALMLTDRYAVPAIAQMLAGTSLTADVSGPVAVDATATGFESINAKTSQERGMVAMTKEQYADYNKTQTATLAQYVQEQQYAARQTPFDVSNPYSALGSMASVLAPVQEALYANNLGTSFSKLASIPTSAVSSIFKALSPTSFAASTDDVLSYCDDPYANELDLAMSPFCVPQYGFGNMAMLKNTTPDSVIKFMYDSNNIDDNGQTIDGSPYDDFKKLCFDSSKIITDIDVEGGTLDPLCFGSAKTAGSGSDSSAATLAATEADNTKNMFRLYAIDTSVYQGFNSQWGDDELGISNLDNATTTGTTGSTTPVSPVTGDGPQLAAQILASPQFTFTTSLAKTAMENASKGLASAIEPRCGGGSAVLSPVLLQSLLQMSQTYKIGIGYLTNGCHMTGSKHYSGRAVDINTVNGIRATGNSQLDRTFMTDYAKILPSGGGLGQKQCMGSIPLPSGITYFNDTCNHLHIDVPTGGG